MKKFFRNQKGFSMIELLVALLIMAVIAGIAMAVFGNIVGKTRHNADEESAAQIKKQIMYYISEANDPNLSCIAYQGTSTATEVTANELVDRLGGILIVTQPGVDRYYTGSTQVKGATHSTWGGNTAVTTEGEVIGEYGPYIDGTKQLRPQAGDLSWYIDVNTANQQVTVTTTGSSVSDTLNIHNN